MVRVRTTGLLTLILAATQGGFVVSTVAAATFTPLGDLPGGATWSEANDVAAHGLVVVGSSQSTSGTEAFRWTPNAGLQALGDLSGGPFHSEAHGVSHDGSVIVGWGASELYPASAPFRIDPGGSVAGSALTLPLWAVSGAAYDVSADGSIVVGYGRNSSNPARNRALKWTDTADPVQIYSSISANAHGISADGSTIVGAATTSCFFGCNRIGVRWPNDDSFDTLGSMDLGEAVSSGGAIVVGYTPGASGGADRWTESTGVVHLGNGRAHDVSADGKIIVGKGSAAFVWDAVHGYRDLKAHLEEDHCLDLTGWTLSEATGISPDGTVIVGVGVNPSGEGEAWMVHLPQRADGPPATCLDYVALGDSYSSGVGLGFYHPGTALPGFNTCHRSVLSYPYRIRNPGGASIDLAKKRFLACSGAGVVNVRSGGASPAFGTNEAAQLDQTLPGAGTPVLGTSTEMVTITIGGNDVLFAKVLRWCLEEPGCGAPGYHPIPGDARSLNDIALDLLDAVGPMLRTLFDEIRSQTGGNAAIFAFGYPNVLPESIGESSLYCETLGEAFDTAELPYLRSLAEELNGQIEQAAGESGVHFVPVAARFDGREVCAGEGPEWIFRPALGLSLASTGDLSFVHRRSFHPNSRGHLAFANAFSRHLDRLGSGWPTLPSGLPENPEPLATVPPQIAAAAGEEEPLPSLGPLSLGPEPSIGCDPRGRVVPGQAVRIEGTGYAPGAALVVLLKTTDGYRAEIGSIQAGPDGSVDAVVTVPSGAPASGAGVAEVHGARVDGGPHILEAGLGFASSTVEDGDGDGVPDLCDVCPLDVDSTQSDMDGDGIGDACDVCAADPANDLDGDGLCAGADPCEFTEINDPDGDGVCTESFRSVPVWPAAWIVALFVSIAATAAGRLARGAA